MTVSFLVSFRLFIRRLVLWLDSIHKLIQKRLCKFFVLQVDSLFFIRFLFFLLFLLNSLSLFLLLFSSQMLRFFKSLFKFLIKVLHTLNLSVPEFVHCFVFISNFSHQSKWKFQDMKSTLLTAHGQNVKV